MTDRRAPAYDKYKNSEEHLRDELGRLDLLLRREVLLLRQWPTGEQSIGLQAMFVSDAEIDAILTQKTAGGAGDGMADPIKELTQAAAESRTRIDERKRASAESGVFLTLPRLALLFGLTPVEEAILLVCLAPEIDLAYGRIYAYLQNDLTRKKPSMDLAARLAERQSGSRTPLRSLFSAQGPLFRDRLVRQLPDNDDPFPARQIKLDERIAGFLLESSGMSTDAAACIESMRPPQTHVQSADEECVATQVIKTATEHLSGPQSGRKLIVHVHGPAGVGKKAFAGMVCGRLGVTLIVVDLREVIRRAQSVEEMLRAILRECLLRPAAVYLDNFDAISGDEEQFRSYRHVLARAIEDFSWLAFIGAEKEWKAAELFRHHLFIVAELTLPVPETRLRLWQALAAEAGGCAEDIPWEALATMFRFTPGQIRNALQAARNSGRLRGKNSVVTIEDLTHGCRAQSNHRLGALARKIAPRAGWSDIVLPENSLQQLREICAQMKHRRTVYGAWGFEKKLSLGKGLCTLFSGPSGTGKTLAVEVIANELRLEAYKIDLSTVVSKYIGETEKNLRKVFEEAEASNAILFFDEADALFGKRSEVKDAHDRYANIEINYLLQRMEEFEGLVILASNLRKNIDDAFFRRMHFAVEFPFPDAEYRYRIWRQHMPPEAPFADDIDLNFLANRCILAGGSIKNIMVNAAFLAAENSGVIHMDHIIRAVRREYEKIGKMCTEAEFGSYHAVLREA